MFYSDFLKNYITNENNNDYDYEYLPSIMFGDDTKEYLKVSF